MSRHMHRRRLLNYPKRVQVSAKHRPERRFQAVTWFDVLIRQLVRWCLLPLVSVMASDGRSVKRIIQLSDAFSSLSEQDLSEQIKLTREKLLISGVNRRTIIEAFALIREVSGRSLGMRHHATQIRASLILLRGMVAEMATGEGKTLAATLASSTAAMAGIKVHIITTNDYLAQRDCEEMLPLYQRLGLSVQSVTNELSPEERAVAYACDLVYCTNSELVFDYLKDMLVLSTYREIDDIHRAVLDGNADFIKRLMHQGLNFAIVDEADSVFIDEARTPLVISGGDISMDDEEEFLRTIMTLALSLEEQRHYKIDWKNRRISLLKEGVKEAESVSLEIDAAWSDLVRREQMLCQALTALYLFDRDKHYIVADDKIVIVDEYTGRTAEDRSWEGGLHQLMEIKEDCPLTKPQKTLAKISYQNFFRKYYYLAGMTGTAKEVKSELLNVYGLYFKKVPLLKKSKRFTSAFRVFCSQQEKESAIVSSALAVVAQGRSVLIGSASVSQSESLARLLDEQKIDFCLLTAKHNSEEADVVASAGHARKITIATSMAGRGTDIKLDGLCKGAGGLHVIISELNDAARVDRQLAGRCARQGDPGSVEYCLAMDDPIVQMFAPRISRLLVVLTGWFPLLRNNLGRVIQANCQWRLEKKHFSERRMTMKTDEQERQMLALLGGGKGQ